MKNQAFGVEIELTGISREKAAKVIAGYFGTESRFEGGAYDKYTITDSLGRKWQVVKDGSIDAQYKNGGAAPGTYKVELVTPKCKYSDIETIQEIIRKLRKAGAITNKSCGIHIHVDAANHNAKTLKNLVNIMASKEDLIYRALEVDRGREARYCQKVDKNLIERVNQNKPKDLAGFEQVWYNGECGRYSHYHPSRYHGFYDEKVIMWSCAGKSLQNHTFIKNHST